MLRERFIVDGYVEAGHATHLLVTQWGDDRAQVVRLDPDVTVADDQKLALRFLHHPHQLGHLVVDSDAFGTKKQADSAFGEITYQFFQNRHRRVITISDAKNQLIVRIILLAETRVVFSCFGSQSPDSFQIPDRRDKVRIPGPAVLRATEKTP